MRPLKHNLIKQLLSIAIITVGIIFIAIGILLPKVLVPIYEGNIYQYLKQPLDLINRDFKVDSVDSDVVYLYVNNKGDIISSSNLTYVIDITPKQVLENIKNEYGKFNHEGRTYYYNTSKIKDGNRIAITNDEYINRIKKDVLYTIFPILLFTLVIISGLILFWSRNLLHKIEHLKEKVDNLDNDDYKDNYNYKVDDELKALSNAIDEMKLTLKEQDEYKNQMYQNISHDFKTPLTVIKSYIEAIEDGVENKENGLNIIKEEVNKLELKVHSLLYLNKLNYIKDLDSYHNERVNVVDIVNKSITKFKVIRPDIKWDIKINDSKTTFKGTYDMWETIIDNLFNNFMRYTEKNIIITIKNGKITLYNDGSNIDESVIDDIFTPYKKGIKGQFGLGLSIVKKTLAFLGYEISIKNEKKGVSFIIK